MQMPADRGVVLNGHYLLFAMTADGTPASGTSSTSGMQRDSLGRLRHRR
jgi:hypothetical protein